MTVNDTLKITEIANCVCETNADYRTDTTDFKIKHISVTNSGEKHTMV